MHALAGVSLRSAVNSRRSACRSLTFMTMSALILRRISSMRGRGSRGLEGGTVDLKARATGERTKAPLAEASQAVADLLTSAP